MSEWRLIRLLPEKWFFKLRGWQYGKRNGVEEVQCGEVRAFDPDPSEMYAPPENENEAIEAHKWLREEWGVVPIRTIEGIFKK